MVRLKYGFITGGHGLNWNIKTDVINAVRKNGLDLRFASTSLRHDRAVVLAAIENNPVALKYAGDDLKYDPEIMPYAFDLFLQGCFKSLITRISPAKREGTTQKDGSCCDVIWTLMSQSGMSFFSPKERGEPLNVESASKDHKQL